MSMARVAFGSRASSSSGVTITYRSGETSKPFTILSYGTSSPVSADTRFWRMRAPVPSSSWLNRTSLGETALNSFTGTLTSPKLIAPLQMALGMALVSHLSGDFRRVLVLPLAFVGRVTQDADARPLGEGHLDDELGLDP